MSQAANDLLRDAGQSASSFIVAGNAGTGQASKSTRFLALLGGPRADGAAGRGGAGSTKVPDAVRNADTQSGGKSKTLFEKFKNIKIVDKLGGMMGKLQLKAPIHLIDSMITYSIGVISGMQDMAQVRVCFVSAVMFYYCSLCVRVCVCVCVCLGCSRHMSQNIRLVPLVKLIIQDFSQVEQKCAIFQGHKNLSGKRRKLYSKGFSEEYL